MSVDMQAVREAVNEAHAQYARLAGGANASYIPYLASVPRDAGRRGRGHGRRPGRRRPATPTTRSPSSRSPRSSPWRWRWRTSGPRSCAPRSAPNRPACPSIPSWRSSCTAASRCRRWSMPGAMATRQPGQGQGPRKTAGHAFSTCKAAWPGSAIKPVGRGQHVGADHQLPQPCDRVAAVRGRHDVLRADGSVRRLHAPVLDPDHRGAACHRRRHAGGRRHQPADARACAGGRERAAQSWPR